MNLILNLNFIFMKIIHFFNKDSFFDFNDLVNYFVVYFTHTADFYFSDEFQTLKYKSNETNSLRIIQ